MVSSVWILGKEVLHTNTSGRFLITFVQDNLLFGSETWVVTPYIKHLFGGFHHMVVRRILCKMLRQRTEGTCEYPPLGDAMTLWWKPPKQMFDVWRHHPCL